MPKNSTRLTDRSAAAIAPPAAGYELHWCPETSGFALRVTAAGARAWIAERRLPGKGKVRRALGRAPGDTGARGTGAIVTADAARRLQITLSSELQQGVDRRELDKAKLETEKKERVTFGDALRRYVKTKRRKDGKALKDRTKADYEAMLAPATATARAGELYPLAGKSLHKITGAQIVSLHESLEGRGQRRQAYAAQVLRAVLRHNGIVMEDNPFSAGTAGAKRVYVAASKGNPSPIKIEQLGDWWRAAITVLSTSGDQLRFQLLTGCRPGEASGLLVGDVDLLGKRVTLRDTKNRSDFVILLSKQALSIARQHCRGKGPKAPLFGILDAGKTIAAINAEAGTPGVTPHRLRHTFASLASELVPATTLRRMLNHTTAGDTASRHYIGTSDAQLRDAWQKVAHFIEAAS